MLQESLLARRPLWLAHALDALGRHELLTPSQLAHLVDEPRGAVDPVLGGLAAEGLLTALATVPGPDVDAEPAYALTPRGARLAGHARRTARRHSPFTIHHDVLRNELGIALELLDRRGTLRLLAWETVAARLADATWLLVGRRAARVPLVADALALVDPGDGPSALLIETDRGTVSFARMALRYRAYQSWWQEGGPVRRFGARRLRVLTLVPDEARLDRLRIAALEATGGRGSGLFWFAQQSLVDLARPEALLTAAWWVARADDTLGPERLFAGLSSPSTSVAQSSESPSADGAERLTPTSEPP